MRATYLILIFIGFSIIASAKDPVYTKPFSKTALEGYDAVSYYQEDGTPLIGKKANSIKWRGAVWHFASAENLKTFKEAPDAYAPQYGGHCAWAVAQGKLAKGDPRIFAIVENKLYLNYNEDIADRWESDRSTFISKADQEYPKLVKLDNSKE